MRVFTTLIKPDAGRAFIDGIDVLAEPMRAKARIGLTGQYAAVDERLTGHENLEHVGRLYHMPDRAARERGRELLERFDLVDAGDRVVKGYSGGMRRRLDIAMSLIARPSVLFLDEPTTGLDPRSRLAVWDLIEELVAGGTTTLLTTQYLDEADRLADEIMVIDHGRVIARGHQRGAQAARSAATASRSRCADAEQADAGRARSCAEPGVRTDPRRRGPAVARRARRPRSRGMVPDRRAPARRGRHRRSTDVAARQSTLDDVFFALTGHERRARPSEPEPSPRRWRHDDDRRHPPPREPVELAPATAAPSIPMGRIWLLKDSWTEATRHLRAVPRNPELLIFATIQPIMFIVLFVYVFGGSVDVPIDYVQYVIPGIFAQTVLFNSAFTGVGVADDLSKGIIDRLRSLPMYQSAVLIGRTRVRRRAQRLDVRRDVRRRLPVGFRFEGTLARGAGGDRR